MPMPVSVTEKWSWALVRVPPTRPSTCNDHIAALGELDRVADQIDQDLPQPQRVAHDQWSGTSPAISRGEFEPFLIGAHRRAA